MYVSWLRVIAVGAFSFAFLLSLSGCGTDSSDVLGQAYVAPASLNLRRQLAEKNESVEMLKHGDRVSIVEVRRRFVKVRTAKGAEGWLDSLDLLSADDMARIRKERQQALTLPSQGSATVYEPLNIHLDPNRKSAAFARIAEGDSVTVLAHRIAPRTADTSRPPLVLDPPHLAPRRHRESKARNTFRLPPPPPPPRPPENWESTFRGPIDRAKIAAELKDSTSSVNTRESTGPAKKPVPMEDWTLIRTKDNQCGWVLSRNLILSIPDEVAQYAEGKRITSYFDLGTVNDEEKGPKHNWLWTTSSEVQPFDFDAWRVFLWNRRRHRYETSYRQRDLEGYFPVHVDPPDSNAFGRSFQLITKDDDGQYRRRSYLFDGVRVHLTGTEDYHPSVPTATPKRQGLDTNKLPAKPHASWLRREWEAFKRRLSPGN